MRFGALLSQNLKRGSKGLADLLRLEAVNAFEERKRAAKKAGEEVGTKLLAPMFFMLTVVLVIVDGMEQRYFEKHFVGKGVKLCGGSDNFLHV